MISRARIYAIIAVLLGSGLVYGLIPPPHSAKAQFAGQNTFIKQTGGSANAQTLVVPNVGSYADLLGVPITIIPSFTNTGPTTFNVNGLGALAISRLPTGATLGGGEIPQNSIITIMYAGLQFILVSPQDITPVGTAIEIRGSVAPTGYLLEDGSCVSQTNYASLFSVIGASYGACGGGLFALPDSRGTMFAATDNQGANGSAGRITNAGSGCTANSVPFSCGVQNKLVTTTFLPASGLSVPSLSVTTATSNVGVIPLSSGAISSLQTQGNPTANITPANNSGSWSGTTSLSATGTTGTGTTGNMGTGTAMPILNPILGGLRAIKY